MRLLRPSRDEHGIAMITAILVSGVVLTLSITATSLAIHNTNASGLDRKRVQVIATAEAGVDAAFSVLQTTPTASLPCQIQATLQGSPAQQYTANITYYDLAGSPSACTGPSQGGTSPPARAVINSTGGSLPTAVTPGAKRTMQSEVVLHPVYGGFSQAIFSDQSPSTNNNLTVNGQNGDDATVYTNGSWTCANSMIVHGSMVAQGSVSMSNSCQVTRDAWAKQSVTMHDNTLVGHNVSASRSSITLQNSAHILNNATAGTTITSNGHIDGTSTQNASPNDPPPQSLPAVPWDLATWQAAGWTVQNQSCSQVGAVTSVTTKTAYRITPACAVTWSNNTTVNISADTAIVTDGSLTMVNQVNFQSGDGNVHNLLMIVPSSASDGGSHSCTGSVPANISTSNNTSFVNLRIFIYTPCTATFNNNNAGIGGQIFGGTVNIANQFTLNFLPEIIPGAGTVTGYNVDIAYLREVVNPAGS